MAETPKALELTGWNGHRRAQQRQQPLNAAPGQTRGDRARLPAGTAVLWPIRRGNQAKRVSPVRLVCHWQGSRLTQTRSDGLGVDETR
eukprot:130190-Chlamydomonas_euryale.AAC.3